ncbi:uncharacterized protein N7482_001386 [Penicillium canariense]|uniref:Uncharacterized protein n=1 Tax=Penicillium canariense TaxID=189055 RepID=A0A9W9IDA9_9EURO|nr:uncharacterized protein N7482_001386 [Penicillium canariense]KAJ5175509.1 hypothetical protein N7482_001386 [Penicillium canariense]
MARSDSQYGREPAFAASKNRRSTDSASLSRSKRNIRTGSRPSVMEVRGTPHDGGLAPSQLDSDTTREPSPFPEYSDQSLSSESKGRGPMRSANIIPGISPGERPWNLDPTHSMSSMGLTDSSEGLDSRPHKSKPMKPKVHIKPMLRKMSRDDAVSPSIDLSRSSTEQEGLGIYLNLEQDRRRSESLTGVTYRRTTSGMHHRSTSGTSQLSTTTGSSAGKQGSQYVYPMRPTPRAYTPPLSQSHQTSGNDSDELDDGSPETQTKMLPDAETHRTVRASSGPVPRLSLQIEDDSFTRLPGISQTNVSGRPSFGYSRDNGSMVDTASPVSRPSLDFVFRTRTRTSTDPVSRAATIQAARQAFEEKEAAKARRLEKQQIKAEERQTRRRGKHNMSGGQESPIGHSSEELSEKPGDPTVPKRADTKPVGQQWKSQSKSTWVLFMTWLRTRVFKFRRRMRKMS